MTNLSPHTGDTLLFVGTMKGSIAHREAGSRPHGGVLEALRSPSTVSERVAVRLWDRGLCGTKEPVPLYEPCFPVLKGMAADITAFANAALELPLTWLEA